LISAPQHLFFPRHAHIHSGIETTVDYIKRQAEHHHQRSFKEELIEFLKKHNQSYDDTMLD